METTNEIPSRWPPNKSMERRSRRQQSNPEMNRVKSSGSPWKWLQSHGHLLPSYLADANPPGSSGIKTTGTKAKHNSFLDFLTYMPHWEQPHLTPPSQILFLLQG